ncbi:MAG: hypothetical protein BWY24_00443 [Microgenomates group bacterium ADurb.Bin219]|nr:MAG: hypothetical protein BWY24_00443 [Microgenomates group bacterium ADurb.Bin219]
MKQLSTFIYSCLIFLLTLVLFKVIIYALGAVLIFLVGSLIVEFIWEHHNSPLFLAIINPVINISSSAILSLSFYSLLFLPVEFVITEILFITPKLPSQIAIVFIILLVVIFSLVNWQSRLKTIKYYLMLLLFFSVCGLVYLKYREEKLAREYLPKIYSYSPKRGIQAELVKIGGVNFGPVWKGGEVYLGEERMGVVNWDDKSLLLEIPVPRKFGMMKLKVITKEGKNSNPVQFEIRNPATLNQVEK